MRGIFTDFPKVPDISPSGIFTNREFLQIWEYLQIPSRDFYPGICIYSGIFHGGPDISISTFDISIWSDIFLYPRYLGYLKSFSFLFFVTFSRLFLNFAVYYYRVLETCSLIALINKPVALMSNENVKLNQNFMKKIVLMAAVVLAFAAASCSGKSDANYGAANEDTLVVIEESVDSVACEEAPVDTVCAEEVPAEAPVAE